MLDRPSQFRGLLLGTAVGDAIGLPREGLTPKRAAKLFGPPPFHHALIGPFGMISDDTEHACLTAQALLASRGDPSRFVRSLAWRLRGWFIALPPGVGLATARACIKLCLGFSPYHSGVHSAGNGPAMRAAILGAFAADNPSLLRDLVRLSTRITHTDPAAEHGTLAIALAAASQTPDADSYLSAARANLPGTSILPLLEKAVAAVKAGNSLPVFLKSAALDNGISGYINHTVPAAIFCWLKWPTDFRTAIEQVISAGGDTDTTAAIVGALVGRTAGPDAIPPEWLAGIKDFPRTVPWLAQLADRLASPHSPGPLPLFWPLIPVRNLFLLIVVLVHGLRRLLPPY